MGKEVAFLTAIVLSLSKVCYASGVLPETTIVFVNEDEGGGSINVKNTDNSPLLLYVKVMDVPEDKNLRVYPTQPVSRINGGGTQRVRFIYDNANPIDREHYKRVVFEGIPEKKPGVNSVSVAVRQDLPMIITPKNMPAPKNDVWRELKWYKNNGKVFVSNDTRYVIRLLPNITFNPKKERITMARSYILPGESLVVSDKGVENVKSIEYTPASRYGFALGRQVVELK